MKSHHRHSRIAVRRLAAMVLAACCATGPTFAHAQVLTGALVGTVRDAQGSVLSGATVRVTSAALIGGESTVSTGDRGQLRFPALPPGVYRLEITAAGFAAYREEGLEIRAGGTTHRSARSRVQHAFWSRGSRQCADSTLEHVRLRQGGAGCIANLAE
jgi:hypothetical protein